MVDGKLDMHAGANQVISTVPPVLSIHTRMRISALRSIILLNLKVVDVESYCYAPLTHFKRWPGLITLIMIESQK